MRIHGVIQSAGYTAMLALSAACSQHITPAYDSQKTADGRMLAAFKFAPEKEESPTVGLYKIQKGYALKSMLDADTSTGRRGDIVLSKDKEYDWFAGLQWRFTF